MRDAGFDVLRGERFPEPVGVIASVAEHQPGALVVAHLAFGEQHDEGFARTTSLRQER